MTQRTIWHGHSPKARHSGGQVGFRKHNYKISYWRWWNSSWAISNPKRCCCESVALYMSANLENSAVFIPIPKKGNAKECSNYSTIAFISHANKTMLKILQARNSTWSKNFQKYKLDLEKAEEGIRAQIANIYWIIEKAREFQEKTSTSVSFTMLKPLTVWITTNWKILKEMGIPDHLTCLLRNMYSGQEATVRTRHGLVPNCERSTSRLYIVTLLI